MREQNKERMAADEIGSNRVSWVPLAGQVRAEQQRTTKFLEPARGIGLPIRPFVAHSLD